MTGAYALSIATQLSRAYWPASLPHTQKKSSPKIHTHIKIAAVATTVCWAKGVKGCVCVCVCVVCKWGWTTTNLLAKLLSKPQKSHTPTLGSAMFLQGRA